MRYAFTPLAFAVGSSALAIRTESQQCVQLQASGGASGTLGQLSDGQNRIGGGYGAACYCLDASGGFTDTSGRGCILTPPTTQFQCDVGASPTNGFAINGGSVTYNGNSKFYACPATDTGEYNVYSQPVSGQDKCVEITLGAGQSCGGGNGGGASASAPAQSQPAASKPAASQPGYSTPPMASQPPKESAPPAPSKPAPSQPGYSAPPMESAPPKPAPPQPPMESAPAPSQPGYSAPPMESAPPKPAPPQPPMESAPAPSQPAPPQPPKESAPPAPSQPGYSAPPMESAPPKPAPPQPPKESAPPAPPAESAPPAPSQPAQPSPPSNGGGYGNGGCPADLNGGYQYPHLIIPVSSSQPSNAAGTSYNGQANGDVCSLFNFDIPQSYSGHSCSLLFLFPEQKDLETSSYTVSGSGGLEFSYCDTTATQQTSWDSKGTCTPFKTIDNVSPGNSYSIVSESCPAGKTVTIEMCATGGLSLEYFQDYNPSPIGAFVREC